MSLINPGPASSLESEIADVCQRLMPEFEMVSIEPAVHESSARRSVYRVVDRKGSRRLLKLFREDDRRGRDRDALSTESATLRQLHRLGCPVPELLADDADIGAIATEWLPGDTLESRLQSGAISPKERRAVVRALSSVDIAFREITETQGRERRGRVAKELVACFRNEISDLVAGPPWFVRSDSTGSWTRAIDEAFELLIEGDWSHGSLDCSASNIMLASGQAYVIDFSILGAEWCERRTVRYGVATGSGRSGDGYKTLFDVATAGFYSARGGGADSSEEFGARLDLHHLLLLLLALSRPGDAETPSGWAAGEGSDGAEARENRERKLLEIALRPLGPDPVGDSLRACLISPAIQ